MTVLARPEVVIGGNARALDRALGQAAAKLQRAGATMQRVGTQFTTRVTLPILGIGVAAAKATADWETAMVGVQKTVDASADEIARLGEGFVRLSEEVPLAASEFAGIASEAGQLGIALENLGAFSEVVAGLRVATNLGEQAGSTLARLANIMGTSQTDFDRMGSTIVDLGNNLATTEAEIADMSLRIAGAGRQVGLTEAQVLSFAGALSSVGVRAEAGGTAISRTMVEIATAVELGGESLALFASTAGMTIDAFSEEFETNAAGAITAFIAGLGDLESQGKSTFGTLEELGLADVRVRDVLLRASNASDLFTDALVRGTQAWEENTALTKEAGLFYGRLAARFTTLKNKLVNVTAEFGNALRPAIEKVIQGANALLNVTRGLVQRFAALEPAQRIQVVRWIGIAAGVALVSAAIGIVISAFSAVLGAIATVGSVLAGLIAIVVAVRNNWLGMGDAAAAAWSTTLAVAERALTGIVNFVKPIANFLIGFFVGTARAAFLSWDIIRFEFVRAFGKIRDFARPILEGLATAFSVLGRAGKMAAFEIRRALSDAGDEGEEGGTNIGRRIAEGFQEAFATDYVGAFVGIVRTGVERAQTFIAQAIARLRAMMGGGGGGGGEGDAGGGGLFPGMSTILGALEMTMQRLRAALNSLAGDGAKGFDVMKHGADALKGAAVDFAVEFSFALGDAVTDGVAAFKRFGEFVLRTLAQIAAKLAIFKALSFLFPGSGFVGALGKSFGFAGGFASGGHIPAGQFGLVGEAGRPEVVSSPSFVQGPADVTPVGTGGTTVLQLPAPRSNFERLAQDYVADVMRQLEHNGFRVQRA